MGELMPMFKRGCVVLLVIVASACGGGEGSSLTGPSNRIRGLSSTSLPVEIVGESPRLVHLESVR
jgi:hypothetical protein